MSVECESMWSMDSKSRRKALMMELMPLVSGPFQPVQSFGSKSSRVGDCA